jgi:hypothetical protein
MPVYRRCRMLQNRLIYRTRVDQRIRPVLQAFADGGDRRLCHRRLGEPTAATRNRYPDCQHLRRGSAGHHRHADDRHRTGGDHHKAWPGSGSEHEGGDDRQTVTGVGSGTDIPKRGL